MTLHDVRSACPPHTATLTRFVVVGLLAVVESFRRRELPLHRLATELRARTEVLAGLHPPTRPLTRLRWLHREVSRLDRASRAVGRGRLTPDESARLDAAVLALRSVLAGLLSPDPLDPAGGPRAATGVPALAPAPRRGRTEVPGDGDDRGHEAAARQAVVTGREAAGRGVAGRGVAGHGVAGHGVAAG